MSACTFFGDRDCPDKIYDRLVFAIEELITSEKADTFYVGGEGNFDRLAQKALLEVGKKFPEIKCFIVLAYLPKRKRPGEMPPLLETIYPEGMEKSPPRYAITSRNRWMLENAEYVAVYPSLFGNSRDLCEYAEKKGKKVIDLKNKK